MSPNCETFAKSVSKNFNSCYFDYTGRQNARLSPQGSTLVILSTQGAKMRDCRLKTQLLRAGFRLHLSSVLVCAFAGAKTPPPTAKPIQEEPPGDMRKHCASSYQSAKEGASIFMPLFSSFSSRARAPARSLEKSRRPRPRAGNSTFKASCVCPRLRVNRASSVDKNLIRSKSVFRD